MEDVITKAIKDLETSFRKDELAYLALTSKVENPLRDRIAYNIFNEIKKDPEKDYLVCREWRGNFKEEGKGHPTDIAILKKGHDKNEEPIVLIEFKAQSVPGYTKEYSWHMKHDLNYLKIKAGVNTKLYYILFTNFFENHYTNLSKSENALEDDIYGSVKYFEKINTRIKKYKKDDLDLRCEIRDTWKKHIKFIEKDLGGDKIENKCNKDIEISGGEYHGHKISVIAQVLGPLSKAELINLKNSSNVN